MSTQCLRRASSHFFNTAHSDSILAQAENLAMRLTPRDVATRRAMSRLYEAGILDGGMLADKHAQQATATARLRAESTARAARRALVPHRILPSFLALAGACLERFAGSDMGVTPLRVHGKRTNVCFNTAHCASTLPQASLATRRARMLNTRGVSSFNAIIHVF